MPRKWPLWSLPVQSSRCGPGSRIHGVVSSPSSRNRIRAQIPSHMIDLTTDRVGGSFRDPSGYVFKQNGTLYRHVALSYRENYDMLISSGLYQALVKEE